MNEGVLRSPKWLRNFVDFEINTGEDIKGEPSKKRAKQLEEERKIKEEERLKEFLRKEEEKRKEKEEQKKREQEEIDILVAEFIKNTIYFIWHNYKDCHVEISTRNNEIIISCDVKFDGKDLKFEIILENTYVFPKFRSKFNYNGYVYSSTFSGLNYTDFKIFLLQVVYPYYSSGGYKSKSNKKTRGAYEENNKKTSNSQNYSNDTEEIKKKRRLYILLKDTLSGYQRQWDKIIEWEKQNPGKKHTDKETTKNEIDNIKDKIKNIKDKYKFESLNHLKSFIFY